MDRGKVGGMGQVELVFGIIDASMDAFRTLI